MRRTPLGAALIAFLIISPIFAQTTTGRISGTFTDVFGGVIMNVKVTITDETTGSTRTASTDENGLYVVTNLPAGVYSVLRKRTRINERVVLRFQADLFNAFNRANFTGLTTSLTDIDFGRLESTGQPRQIQFGLKVEF